VTARVRVGTRPSPLAITQAQLAVSALRDAGRAVGLEVETELVEISTTGDVVVDRPFTEIGTKGIFTSELQEALADGRVDVAVHSAKDLTGSHPSGLEICVVLPRADVRDVVVSRTGGGLGELPASARVGTSSVRRRALLGESWPGLRPVDLRGNVGTRVRKVMDGEVDAAVLAAAGLMRLRLADVIVQWLDPRTFCPSPGQGIIAIEAASDRVRSDLAWVRGADDDATRAAFEAERALVAAVEGGCTVPLGAWARLEDGGLACDAFVGSVDGARVVRASRTGPSTDPGSVGRAAAEALLEAGAGPLLTDLGRPGGSSGPR